MYYCKVRSGRGRGDKVTQGKLPLRIYLLAATCASSIGPPPPPSSSMSHYCDSALGGGWTARTLHGWYALRKNAGFSLSRPLDWSNWPSAMAPVFDPATR